MPQGVRTLSVPTSATSNPGATTRTTPPTARQRREDVLVVQRKAMAGARGLGKESSVPLDAISGVNVKDARGLEGTPHSLRGGGVSAARARGAGNRRCTNRASQGSSYDRPAACLLRRAGPARCLTGWWTGTWRTPRGRRWPPSRWGHWSAPAPSSYLSPRPARTTGNPSPAGTPPHRRRGTTLTPPRTAPRPRNVGRPAGNGRSASTPPTFSGGSGA